MGFRKGKTSSNWALPLAYMLHGLEQTICPNFTDEETKAWRALEDLPHQVILRSSIKEHRSPSTGLALRRSSRNEDNRLIQKRQILTIHRLFKRFYVTLLLSWVTCLTIWVTFSTSKFFLVHRLESNTTIPWCSAKNPMTSWAALNEFADTNKSVMKHWGQWNPGLYLQRLKKWTWQLQPLT